MIFLITNQGGQTNRNLCTRTCDSGCSFPLVLRSSNTQPYTDTCLRTEEPNQTKGFEVVSRVVIPEEEIAISPLLSFFPKNLKTLTSEPNLSDWDHKQGGHTRREAKYQPPLLNIEKQQQQQQQHKIKLKNKKKKERKKATK